MVNIRKKMVATSKYSLKCPYSMNAQYITIHNTANNANANGEISYMIGNNSMTSYHFAIDEKEVVQAIPTNRNAFACGDGLYGTGNRKSISLEICYSKSGGAKYYQAVALSIKLTAQLLHERGWGTDRVKPHQFWSGKYCPHRIFDDKGWNKFIADVNKELKALRNGTSTPHVTPATNPKPSRGYLLNGDTGSSVKSLQELLNKAGYNVGSADGIFGNNTEKAVRKLQSDHKIKVDGIAGNGTMQILEALTAKKIVKDYLGKNDTGSEVKQLQKDLNKVLNLKLAEDGIFGQGTKDAVMKFQEKYKLAVDGYHGVSSKKKMKEVLADMNKPKPTPVKPKPATPIKEEEEKLELKQWQREEMREVFKAAREKGVFDSDQHEKDIMDGSMTIHYAVYLMTVISGAAMNNGKRIKK